MLTRCPTCQTKFHVTTEQLKARQGRVRCGRCQGVFNALEALVDETTTLTPAITGQAVRETPPQPSPPPAKPAPTVEPKEPAVAPEVEPAPVATPGPETAGIEAETGKEDVPAVASAETDEAAGLLEDEIAEALDTTTIDIVALDDVDFDDEDVFAVDTPAKKEEPPPDFTKTVITDFSRFTSMELPTVVGDEDEVATVVVNWLDESDAAANEAAPPESFVGTVIDFARFPPPAGKPKTPLTDDERLTETMPVANDVVGGDSSAGTLELAPDRKTPVASDEFAQTVVMRRGDQPPPPPAREETVDETLIEISDFDAEEITTGFHELAQARKDEFAETQVVPPPTPPSTRLDDGGGIEVGELPEVDIVIDIEPLAADTAVEPMPPVSAADDKAKTLVEGGGSRGFGAAESATAAPAQELPATDDFEKTVVISMKEPAFGVPGLAIGPSLEPALAAEVPASADESPEVTVESTDFAGLESDESEAPALLEAEADQRQPAEVESVDFDVLGASEPAPLAPAPAAQGEFDKTVILSMNRPEFGLPGLGIEAEPETQDRGDADRTIDFDVFGDQAESHAAAAEEATVDEIATLDVRNAPNLVADAELDDETYAKTVLESIRAAGGITQVDFELEPVDDLHVEAQEEEEQSLVASFQPPRTVFPTLEPEPESGAEVPASADTIMSQAGDRGTAGAVGASMDAEATSEIETITVPPLAGASADEDFEDTNASDMELGAATIPPVLPEDEVEQLPEVPEPVPELQELPAPRRWPWTVGVLVAALALLVQAIIHFRVELAVLMPDAKPALISLCDVFDCKVPLPSRIDLVGIETSDLTPVAPEGAGNLQLVATLRNRAPYVQSWPHLELTLTDAADKALVRRTLAPNEYLPAEIKVDQGFPAHGDQAVHLAVRAPGVPAVGYRLYVFYP